MSFGVLEIGILIVWLFSYHAFGIEKQGRIMRVKTLSDNFFLMCVMSILAFMSMFRGEMIGKDTSTYIRVFSLHTPFDFNDRMEPGYILLCSLIKLLTSNPNAIIIVTGGISIFLFYDFIKKYSKWYFMSVMYFICLGFFDSSLNIIRQSIAVALTTYAYKYIQEHDLKKFILTIITAASFHVTALIVLPVYFIKGIKMNTKNICLIVVITFISYIGFSGILNYTLRYIIGYADYVGSIYGESGKIGALFQVAIYIIILLSTLYIRSNIGSIKFEKSELAFPFYMTLIGTGILILSYNMSIFGRLSQYYLIYAIILIPNILKYAKSQVRMIFALISLLSINIYYWTILILRPNWNAVYPYFIR